MFTRRMIAAAAVATLGVSTCMVATRYANAQQRPRFDQPAAAQMADDPHMMEQKFFQDAASDNTLEIRLSKLAEDRATDPQVKQAAQMMEQDHSQANDLIKRIADQNHILVSVDDLNPVDDAELKKISDLQGDQFTHMYVFDGVGIHARDELVLAFHAHNGTSAPARDYATQILPKVQMHLHALEQIARPMAGLNNPAETAGDKMEPTNH